MYCTSTTQKQGKQITRLEQKSPEVPAVSRREEEGGQDPHRDGKP